MSDDLVTWPYNDEAKLFLYPLNVIFISFRFIHSLR